MSELCQCGHKQHEGKCRGKVFDNDDGGLYKCTCYRLSPEEKIEDMMDDNLHNEPWYNVPRFTPPDAKQMPPFERRQCSKCNEPLGFSESDPCDACAFTPPVDEREKGWCESFEKWVMANPHVESRGAVYRAGYAARDEEVERLKAYLKHFARGDYGVEVSEIARQALGNNR